MVKGVIFDMDGLMFDTESVYGIYWRQVSAELGYPLDDALIASLGGADRAFELNKIIERFGPNVPAGEIIDECHRRTRVHIKSHPIPIKPGLTELLNVLRDRGIPAVIATGTRRISAEDMIARSGVGSFFKAIICGDEVAACKPDPEIFLKAADLIGVPPQDCIVLEDSLNGIIAAHAAGAQPVMIPDCVQPTAEVRALCAHVLTRLDEVIELL